MGYPISPNGNYEIFYDAESEDCHHSCCYFFFTSSK
jgi:hypothetical protein